VIQLSPTAGLDDEANGANDAILVTVCHHDSVEFLIFERPATLESGVPISNSVNFGESISEMFMCDPEQATGQ